MASTSTVRGWYEEYLCNPQLMLGWLFPGWSNPLLVAAPTVPVWEAFTQLMSASGYLFRESAGGTYSCRKISGSDSYSLHSYGLAVDLNPSKNPQGSPQRDDYPEGFVESAEAISCGNGAQCLSWGGRWDNPDSMHWQINCSPADIATGVESQIPAPGSGGDDMRSLRLAVTEAANKGWLPTQEAIDYWYGLAERPDDPEWQDFEDMWAEEKAEEGKALK